MDRFCLRQQKTRCWVNRLFEVLDVTSVSKVDGVVGYGHDDAVNGQDIDDMCG